MENNAEPEKGKEHIIVEIIEYAPTNALIASNSRVLVYQLHEAIMALPK